MCEESRKVGDSKVSGTVVSSRQIKDMALKRYREKPRADQNEETSVEKVEALSDTMLEHVKKYISFIRMIEEERIVERQEKRRQTDIKLDIERARLEIEKLKTETDKLKAEVERQTAEIARERIAFEKRRHEYDVEFWRSQFEMLMRSQDTMKLMLVSIAVLLAKPK